MTPGDAQPEGRARWADALLAAALFASDPDRFGGIAIRARAGPVRDRLLAFLKSRLDPARPWRRLPPGTDFERLAGGLDLEATLAAGRPVARAGLLAEADGGVLLVPMAERLPRDVVGLLAAMRDRGEVTGMRDGVTVTAPARVGLVLLDEGLGAGDGAAEQADPALLDRLAFRVDLEGLALADLAGGPAAVTPADPVEDEAAMAALCLAAARLGVASPRPVLMALAAARALGGGRCDAAGLAAAARLVLAPRATRLPEAAPAEPPPPPAPPPERPEEQTTGETRQEGEPASGQTGGPLPDLLIEAARTALPPCLLAALAAGAGMAGGGRRGAERGEARRGRPAGTRPGRPGSGRRLALVATLRAAAPWQRLRGAGDGRLAIRREDLRICRFRDRPTTLALFLVDASGSAAAERLAEAKGAVELLLADAYVTRAEVALVSFRGAGAELLLPPTRSLARARRLLAGLPGGGGTPLSAALLLGRELALRARAAGKAVQLVLLTDGRANVALDGNGGREAATAESARLARQVRAAGIPATVIDISARPRPEARDLAAALGARLVALPRGPAEAISRAVRAA